MRTIVSVIIPIYNVEEYISKCLNSVINQTYKELEIICVNDCSPDNCSKILTKYAAKDNRIKIINRKKNGGLSAARNSGLEAATGEYIYFIDSDDWIDLDYIETMVNAAKKNDAIVVLNTNIVTHDKNKIYPFHPELTQCNINDTFIDAQSNAFKIIWNTWAYLWKKEFLKRINAKFPEGYIIEDKYFQILTFSYLNKIYVTRRSAYHYLIRESSICGKLKHSSLLSNPDLIIYNKTFEDLMQRKNLEDIHVRIFTTMPIAPYNSNHKIVFLNTVKNYFEKVKPIFLNNQSLYTPLEIRFFNDITNDFENATKTNYQKLYMINTLREQFLNKNEKKGTRITKTIQTI